MLLDYCSLLSRCVAVVGMQRLKTMITVLLLRRTKEDIAATHKLPEKLIHTHTVDLSVEEQNVYDALFTDARSTGSFPLFHTPIPTF